MDIELNTSGKMSHMIPRFATEKEHQWQKSHKIPHFATEKEHQWQNEVSSTSRCEGYIKTTTSHQDSAPRHKQFFACCGCGHAG
jgi:hypothetical protein